MSDSPLPTESTSNHLVEQTQSTPHASLSGDCESRRSCCCCKVAAWLFCIAILMAISIFVAWRLLSPKYTASAYLRVAYREQPLVYPSENKMDETEYQIFKNTQIQLLKNRFVLGSALHRPEGSPISRLSIIKKQVNPVDWLMENLSVSYPGGSEIMEISLTTYDPNDAAEIVNAVIEAYMSEVVDVEREQRRQRISELDRLFTDKEQEVRNRRSELKQLAEQLGTAETETLNLKQKLTLEELATYRQELVHSESNAARLRSKLASLQAKLGAVKNAEISDLECEMFAPNDPILKNLIQQIMVRKSDKEYTSGALKTEENSSKFSDKYQSELDRLENEYSQRIQQIRDEIRRNRQGDVEMKITEVEAAIDIVNKQQKTNEEDVQRLRKLAEQFGYSSVDVEMLRSDIVNREKSLDSIRSEREKLKVELRATSRVIPLQKKAEVPTIRSPLFWIF